MVQKTASSIVAKLQRELATARKHADQAKKKAKLAKLAYRAAKDRLKDCKHAAKKLRKAVKGLEEDLAAAKRKDEKGKPTARPAVIVRKKSAAPTSSTQALPSIAAETTVAPATNQSPTPAQ